ncbi:high molecular weight rhoptry protein 2, putative [Plasmodium berghei]|uniref:High molecular weight rhoptry protein 2 n=2 Tax=Plasmodium berghei TaxID=5821 RepID=RCH2_PLABA|nr:high molecular weight rhoptry protein 2 [Plasmodium berghei ANKA]CXI35931.1 high molecular weight rhoptry protein 2, putative [Plasmodium berghei]SCM21548.1 high molecular weight rhoptry protein 2, putative [Plasmodium berghei]SCN24751.1 high molecular weight rhoptry protein 2, putative [Plasmodium berghei]SCO59885.1 high molecular weight rhoptry protein 2, putative [Plasmodium berghei]SCO61211.1 high molecular weight rhoptry protein 2, putative [Plasmodium berghei]|eukprot:XP_034421275.1 high molecular weight rhoptry protein 2 [Plasmodium berghei ANKA]
MVKLSGIILLSLVWLKLNNSYEIRERISNKNNPDDDILKINVEEDKKKICNNILIFLNADDILTENNKYSFMGKCEKLIDDIKNENNSPDITNEFALSLMHMRSKHTITSSINNNKALKNIIISLDKSMSEPEVINRVKHIIRFNKYLAGKLSYKNIGESLVLRVSSHERMRRSKRELVRNILKDFHIYGLYFDLKSENSTLLKNQESESLINIKNEKLCQTYIHLCQKFYEQTSVYYKIKTILNEVIKHTKDNYALEGEYDISKLFSLENSISQVSQHSDHMLTNESLIYDMNKSNYIKYNQLIHEVIPEDGNIEEQVKKGNGRYIVVVKNLKKAIGNSENYDNIMNIIKKYLINVTKNNKEILDMVMELGNEDIEQFMTQLVFFIHYGFLLITEDKHMIYLSDMIPTYTNLYRANEVLLLHIMDIKFESDDFNKYEKYKFETSDNDKETYSLLNEIDSITQLPKLSENVANDYFSKIMDKDAYTMLTLDKGINKYQFYFTMAFKDCNINQNYTPLAKDLWTELIYTFDNFGWFYFNPNKIMSSISKSNFIRHVLVSRNFILKNMESLIYLDTQISRLMDMIGLSFLADKSEYILDLSLSNYLFLYVNEYHIFKKDENVKLIHTYDYIDSIANNYYYFSEKKYPVFKTDYSSKLYTNFPNVYSLAYQLFNELAINMNISNTPLKKKLKNKSNYAYFTILNLIGPNHDIYSRGPRLIFAAYMLTLVFFIESQIDISRYRPNDMYFMKKAMPLLAPINRDDFNILKKRCSLLTDFIKINRNKAKNEHSRVEEYIKILNLVTILLWGKESNKSLYYDNDVSLYKKLLIACVFNGGITVQEKVIKSIKRSCNMEQYGLNKSNIEDFVNVNLSVYQWNPDILEKIATAFTLTCKVHNMIYEPFDVHKVDAKDYYKLAVAPDMVKTYHCFLLGRQAERLLESLILKKNFVKFKVEDAIDVYEFFYVTRILSKNPREDFELFLKNKKEYQKKQKDEIIKNSKLDENVTDILFQNYECYWFKSYENFKSLWMHAASNLGPGAYLRNFFSEIWNNMGTLFKKQSKVRDVEYFNINLIGGTLIDYYSPLLKSEEHCRNVTQKLFISMKDSGTKSRIEIPDEIKSKYFQCKLDYYKNNHSDPVHKIYSRDFLENKVYVFKQPYYLLSNIDDKNKKQLLRLFITETTLQYLLLDDIQIPECLGRCTIEHFNKVLLTTANAKPHETIIYNGLIPENCKSKIRKEMKIFIHSSFVHNLTRDYLTGELIRTQDIQNGDVHVCMGSDTYYTENILTDQHFDLTHKPQFNFPENNNYRVFLKKNINKIAKNPESQCYVHYELSVLDTDIPDPYREIGKDLITNIELLESK